MVEVIVPVPTLHDPFPLKFVEISPKVPDEKSNERMGEGGG
jgi:hypothetical protein